ncbi:hypothetical protein [Alkaliphilus oremlandii]|uniref:Uncharacterized protein n=1 Tax=Alkaliphilus oremlandii (strain OhILAs) TaxID=350688 RepID=A8MEK0_ALKOO|nr:hypothetical protein [Alkaliphilus oremlandii]ABW18329.1 conserved hypothetical protein [Alkaliphilus oremlandii OhILAs]
MKRRKVIEGLVSLLVGITCLIHALLFKTKLTSLLSGFAGAGISSGTVILWKHYYWSKPENRSKHKEKLENENIELYDERKTMLRDKSGRYAYIVGLITLSISIVIFSILGSLEITADTRLIVLYLGGLLVFEYIIGIIIYKRLSKKY